MHILRFLNKLSAFQVQPFTHIPFDLYSQLFQLLGIYQSNLLYSTIGNFISKTEAFAEYAIQNGIINICICKYSNEQQDMIPWITLCFLSHSKKSILKKIYSLLNYIMENIGIINMNSEISNQIINSFYQLSYQALAQFIVKAQDFSYFNFHYCLSRNITIDLNDDESCFEKYNFIFQLTKNTSSIPFKFPYLNFSIQAMKDMVNKNEKILLIICKCIYNVVLKHVLIEDIIQCGLFHFLQEKMFSVPFVIKGNITKIILELIVNTSLSIQIIQNLKPEFFDFVQDFPELFDENIYMKLSSTMSLISNEAVKTKIKEFIESIIENQSDQIYFQNDFQRICNDDSII